MKRRYRHGYAWAKVEPRADVDLVGQRRPVLDVHAGPRPPWDPLRVQASANLPEAPGGRGARIAPGDCLLDRDHRRRCSRAVLDLGTFSSVEITH